MIVLHHLERSRSQRVLWLLEELGVPYELKVYQRNPRTMLAPPELRAIHPMGKSPVLTDGDVVVAESAAILEYLAETYGAGAAGLPGLLPERGSEAARQARYWLHFAEGSLMNWLLLKLVFLTIPTRPMPFFVRPIARKLCTTVEAQLIDPNLAGALAFMEQHLATHRWFAGDALTVADFQMSYAVEAALARAPGGYPHLAAYRERMRAQPAYQRALDKGGPVMLNG